MNSDLNLPPKDMKPLTHSTQPPTETPSPHINRPESKQQNDQHASQPESVASASQYFAPIQAEFVAECKHYEQHLRQDCDEFASIQKQIIESSDALADKLLTKRKLQQQLKQAKEDKTAQLSLYGLEMAAMKSKLETLGQQLQAHLNEYAQLRGQRSPTAKQQAEEYHKQQIDPLELQIDQLAKDIKDLESTDQQLVNINQEIDKNLINIQEMEKTLQKLMRDLRLKAGRSYLDNINDVLALKAEIANLNQVILKMRDEQRDELIQKDADIAAVRKYMKDQMKELADHMNAEILAIRDEMKQQSGQFRAQNEFQQCQDGLQNIVADNQQELNQTNNELKEVKQHHPDLEARLKQAQFPSSAMPKSTDELLHLIAAPQGSAILLSLTSLDLTQCKLGDKKADFFQALLNMPNLTSLNLNGSGIGDDGAEALGTSKTLTNLASLNLNSNDIGDVGAEALGVSKTLTNLTLLNLSGNDIGAAGAEALAASEILTNLTSLNLSSNNIGDAGAEALAASKTLTNLTSLNLNVNNIGDDGIKALAVSETLTKLATLGLRNNNIGDAGAEALGVSETLTKLISLNLSGNDIGDEAAEALAASKTLTKLTSLNLRNNKIGDEAAEAIKTRYPFVCF